MLNDSLQKYLAKWIIRVTKRDMTGGNSVVGLWRDRERASERVEDPNEALIEIEPQFARQDWDDNSPSPGVWRRRLALSGAVFLALAWLAALGYQRFIALSGRVPTLGDGVDFIAFARQSPRLLTPRRQTSAFSLMAIS